MWLLTFNVSIRKNKGTRSVIELGGVVKALEHEAGKTDGEFFGTGSIHDSVRVGDVVLVIGAVKGIATRPARRKHEFESNSVGTVRIDVSLVREVVTHKGGFALLGIVETVDADGQLLEDVLLDISLGPPYRLLRVRSVTIPRGCEVASRVVSCHHSEARLERLDVLAVQEVVSKSVLVAKAYGS